MQTTMVSSFNTRLMSEKDEWHGSGDPEWRQPPTKQRPRRRVPRGGRHLELTTDDPIRLALDLAEVMGRKFEAEDVEGDDDLEAAVRMYLAAYAGDFDFVLQMREALRRWKVLTPGQMKGVLNAMVADYRRRAAEEQRKAEAAPAAGPAEVAPVLRDGFYTVIFSDDSGDRITVQVRMVDVDRLQGFPQGTQVLGQLVGGDNVHDYERFAWLKGPDLAVWKRYQDRTRLIEAVRILLAGDQDRRREAGQVYAVESGNCYRCGRLLTVPSSIDAGLGPICAGLAE